MVFRSGSHLLRVLRTLRRHIESQQLVHSRPAIAVFASQLPGSIDHSARSFAAGPGSKKKEALVITPEVRQLMLDKQRETHAHKLAYEQQMHSKRKDWMSDIAQLRAAKEKADREKDSKIQEEKAARLVRKAAKAVARKAQLAVLSAREAVIRGEQQQQAAAHRAALKCVYDELLKNRRSWLLEQSRDWIPADQVDNRIEDALDNPERLF